MEQQIFRGKSKASWPTTSLQIEIKLCLSVFYLGFQFGVLVVFDRQRFRVSFSTTAAGCLVFHHGFLAAGRRHVNRHFVLASGESRFGGNLVLAIKDRRSARRGFRPIRDKRDQPIFDGLALYVTVPETP